MNWGKGKHNSRQAAGKSASHASPTRKVLYILPHDIEPFVQQPYEESLPKGNLYHNKYCSLAKSIGWEPTLFYLSSTVRSPKIIRHNDGYDIHLVPVLLKVKGSSGCLSPQMLSYVRKFIKNERPDLVHIHGYYTAMFEPLCFLLSSMGVPFVTQHHGTPMNRALFLVKRALLPLSLSRASMILSSSTKESETLKSWGVHTPIRFQPHPLDMSAFKPIEKSSAKKSLGYPGNSLLVLFLARFSREKNPHGIIRAFTRVQNKFPKARLVLAGTGPLLEDAKSLAKELSTRADFKGFVDDATRILLFQASDVYVLPSVGQESTPLSLVEALACATPCIASDISGIADILSDKKSGYLIDLGNEDQIAQDLIALLSDGKLRKSMGEFGSRDVRKKFSVDVARAALKRNYEEALADFGKR